MNIRLITLVFLTWGFWLAPAKAFVLIGDTSVCVGSSAWYYSPVVPGAAYSWSIAGGNPLSGSTSDSLLVGWPNPGPGSVTVTLTYPNNTQVSYTSIVIVHPAPDPAITHTPYPTCPSGGGGHDPGSGQPSGDRQDCEKVCKLSTITYSTPLNTGSAYLWVASGALSIIGATTNSVSVNWDASPNGSLTVFETNQWGCVDSATLCIEKIDLPVASFSNSSGVCNGSTVYFSNTSVGATSFYWNFGDGGTSTLANPNHTYSNAGTYSITLIAYNDCHCSDTFQSTITVDSLPGPDITCPTTVCADATVTYSTSLSGCVYSWTVIGGTIIGPSNQQSVMVLWGPGQIGWLGLSVSGCGALCSDTTWMPVPIIPLTGTISGPSKVCPGECHTFSLPYFSGTTYAWSLNSGSCGTMTDSTCCNEVEICWPPFTGPCNDTLTVSFYNQILGCGGTASLIIRVRPELMIYGPAEACANGTTGFASSGGIACNWSVSPAGPVISGSPGTFISIDWQGNPGNYQVTAEPVNPNQACNDSVSKLVSVISPPAAPVITGGTLVCAGDAVQYCATGTGNLQWIITGGTPASGAGNCVTVNWGMSPPFSVKAFTVMNASPYCSSDTTILNVNAFSSIPVPLIGGSAVGCANSSSTYICSTPLPPGTSYTWTMIPANAGSIISGQGTPLINIEWGNNAPQVVTLRLKASICSGTDSSSFTISLNPAPAPVINQTGSFCSGGSAQLNVTGGAFAGYGWSGPGGFAAVVNPVTITQEGLYKVTVTDANGCTALTQINVQAVGDPVASISAQGPLNYCTGSSWALSLCALGNPGYTYQWSNAATSQCASVSTPGSYSVTVTNANGCSAASNVITVTETTCGGGGPGGGTPCSPNGNISFSHSSCNPKVFTNTSVNGGSFFWNFGDQTYSNLTNPTHTYNQAGFFLVTLIGKVPDIAGLDSCLLQDTALIEIPLLARFGFSSGCPGDPVCFTDQSVFTAGNNITSWSWNFGDASTSSIQNPCHSYSSPGIYPVTLTIANASCTTSWTDTVVIGPGPTAAFTAGSSCSGSPTSFTDNSFSAINYWNWSFGNGGTSLNQNPSATYNVPGSYPVTLIVHDTFGCYDTLVQNMVVTGPMASGSINAFPDTIVCAGVPVTLVAPIFAGFSYSWSTGSTNDTIIVNATGTYSVTITDPNGCSYVTVIDIMVNQPPLALIDGGGHHLCLGEQMNLMVPFNPSWTYQWISNDSMINGTVVSSVFISPSTPGLYVYQVFVTDTVTGCGDTSLPYMVWVTSSPLPPLITPLTPTTICAGDTVILAGSHPDSSVTLSWNTGGVGDTIKVLDNGCYSLTAMDTNGCSSSATYCITVNPLPELCSFLEGCLDTCAPFTIPGPPGNTAYQWLLNGIPIPGATTQNYTAMVGGLYSLIVTNAFGCTDTTGGLDLSLHPCPDSLCADLVIDSVFCDSVAGQYTMFFHVINQSSYTITQQSLLVLPPAQGISLSQGQFLDTLAPGDTSNILSTTIISGSPGDTICFRILLSAYDTSGNLLMSCFSDTQCVILPTCPLDTSCCYFDLLAQSITCVDGPNGPYYQFFFEAEHCGNITINPVGGGTLNVNSPKIANIGLVGISGTWTPSSSGDTAMCLQFLIADDSLFCKDTIICLPLPECPQDTACCSFAMVSDTISCIPASGGSAYQFSIVMEGCGTLTINPLFEGELGLNGPVQLNGGPTTLSGTWIPLNPADTLLCLLFLVNDSVAYCADTIVCFPLPHCSPPVTNTGGCCLPNGNCITTTIAGCRQNCGHWLGLGSNCSTAVCPVKDILSGTVSYANFSKTPLPGVEVALVRMAQPPCGEIVISDPAGHFEFERWAGTYRITASSTRAWEWGAVNAFDALLIAKHFARIEVLSGLYAEAADVDRSGYINTSDAFSVLNRFVGNISSFPAGDWVFTDSLIDLQGGAPMSTEILGLLTGDVNASHILAKNSRIGLVRDDSEVAVKEGQLQIPLLADRDIRLAALSLELILPPELEQVTGVTIQASNGSAVWKVEDKVLRIAWFSLDEENWEQGEALFLLDIAYDPKAGMVSGDPGLRIGENSAASGLDMQESYFNLAVPGIESVLSGLQLLSVQPNPFRSGTEVRFVLPLSAHVKLEVVDALGRTQARPLDAYLAEGVHQVSFSGEALESGVYYLRLSSGEGQKQQAVSKRIVLLK